MKPIFMNKLSFILLSTGIFLSFSLLAQKPPIKFGKISEDVLEMKSYEPDTSAPAVILCDYGVFESATFEFNRVLRIKILKKDGYEWANKIFDTKDKTNIRGYTYNLLDGVIIKDKLKSESIFKERITDDHYRIRVAMPNVKVGSVIDLEFSYDGIPWEWNFQTTIPVVWSELIMEPSQYILFRKNFYGFIPLAESSDIRWVGKDMPAFKSEPYINSIENYLTKIEFDVLSINFPGYYFESYTDSWEDVSEFLLDNSYFGEPLRSGAYLNDLVKSIEAKNITDEEELLKTAFELIKDFKWDENTSLLTTTNNISRAYNKKVGNSAEINLALIKLLDKLDFKVTPVVLSTRKNGILSLINPSLNKLNYVIAKVEINEQSFLLDATEEFTPHTMLPFRCLNWFGHEVNEEVSRRVDLVTNKKEIEQIQANLNLEQDLSLDGNIKFVRKDYAALNFRNMYNQFNSEEEYIDDFVKNHSGIRIKNSNIENLDSIYLPIKDDYDLIIKNKIETIGDEIYLYPMVIDQLRKNPFKLEEREYPIDYGYKYKKVYMVNIELPENFSVVSMPKPVVMRLPDNSINFSYQINVLSNCIHMTFQYQINKVVFTENEYKDLKEFYNQVIIKHAEPVILKRT